MNMRESGWNLVHQAENLINEYKTKEKILF